MATVLISIAAFLGVMALVGALAFGVRELAPSKVEDRLEVMTGQKARGSEGVAREEIIRESMDGLSGMVGNLTQRLVNLSLFFEQADSPIKPDIFFGLTLGCTAVGVIGAWAAGSPGPLYPVAGLIGGSMPWGWLWWRRRGRFKRFSKQLPDALDLIGRALRSGHSLASGLHLVVEEMPAPIATEFAIAYEQQNLGIPIEAALKDILKRVPNMDLKFFVTAVAIQRQTGGDLAEILDKISYVIRERFKIMGQVQALTGEGRISGVVLMALPIALFFAVYHLNPDYVMLLFTDETGRKMIGFAAFLQVAGAIAIKKIVNIKI